MTEKEHPMRKVTGRPKKWLQSAAASMKSNGLASPSSYADGGEVQQTGMALVHQGEKVIPAPQTVAEKNAASWRTSGYDQWRKGDAQRAQDLPVGGMAPIRPEAVPEHLKRKNATR